MEFLKPYGIKDEKEYREHYNYSFSDLKEYPKKFPDDWESNIHPRPEFRRAELGTKSWDVVKLGILCHALVEDPNTFEDKIIVTDNQEALKELGTVVTPVNSYHKSFCDELLLAGTDAFGYIHAYREVYKTDKKTEEEINKNSLELFRKFKGYVNLQEKILREDRISVTSEEMRSIQDTVNLLLNSPMYKGLSRMQDKGWQVFSEYSILWEWMGVPLKSRPDIVLIKPSDDPMDIKIVVIDLKFTEDNVPESYVWRFRDMRYGEQLSFYVEAILSAIKDQYGIIVPLQNVSAEVWCTMTRTKKPSTLRWEITQDDFNHYNYWNRMIVSRVSRHRDLDYWGYLETRDNTKLNARKFHVKDY